MKVKIFLVFMLLLNVLGCADFDFDRSDSILVKPMSDTYLKQGMRKSEVVDKYGYPDSKSFVKADNWSEEREEWFYSGRYSSLPVGAGYLAKDLYLYFDGDILTNISRTAIRPSRKDERNEEEVK